MSNLLDKSSIVLTPTAYNNGEILSVKPTDGTGDFDFTRNSSATRVNSQGLIEDMQILSGDLVSNGDFSQISSELVTNGDFSNGASNWTLAGLTSVVNNSVSFVDNGTNTYSIITQSNIVTANKQYKLTFDINRYVLGEIQIILGSASSVTNQLSQGVGTYTMYLPSGSGTSLEIKRNGAVPNFDFDITNISIKEVGQNWSVTGSDANNYVVFNGSTARLKFLNTSPVTQLATSFVMTAGKKYKLTVDIATVTSGGIKIDGNGISETFNTSGITTRIINPTGATSIKFYRATANVDITLNSVSLIEITDDTNLPRIDYTGGVGHWLFEPQSTNLFPYSEDFSQWYKASGSSVISNALVSPDGTLNADKFVFDGTNNGRVEKEVPTTNGLDYTFSIYLKNKDIANPTQVWIGLEGGVQGQYITITNEWQRFTTIQTANGTSEYPRVRYNGIGSLYAYGAQFEQNSFATSYIPTNGEVNGVTRLKDAAFGAGNSSLINSTEGTLYAEVAALANDGTFRLLSLSDGTSSNRVYLGYNNNDNTITANVTSGGVSQGIISYTTTDLSLFHKVAVKYKNNNVSLYVNGIEVGAFPSATTPSGLNALQFTSGSISSVFFGKTKCVAVFKEALSNDELECLTGEGYDSFNALALANNYTII